MFKNLINNLSKKQKIGLVLVLQIIVVSIIGLVLKLSLAPRQYASIESTEIEKEIDYI